MLSIYIRKFKHRGTCFLCHLKNANAIQSMLSPSQTQRHLQLERNPPSTDIHPRSEGGRPGNLRLANPKAHVTASLSSLGVVGRGALRSQWGWVCTAPRPLRSAAGRCLRWSNASRCCRPCSPGSCKRGAETDPLSAARSAGRPSPHRQLCPLLARMREATAETSLRLHLLICETAINSSAHLVRLLSGLNEGLK